jgi:hypothetical protein
MKGAEMPDTVPPDAHVWTEDESPAFGHWKRSGESQMLFRRAPNGFGMWVMVPVPIDLFADPRIDDPSLTDTLLDHVYLKKEHRPRHTVFVCSNSTTVDNLKSKLSY